MTNDISRRLMVEIRFELGLEFEDIERRFAELCKALRIWQGAPEDEKWLSACIALIQRRPEFRSKRRGRPKLSYQGYAGVDFKRALIIHWRREAKKAAGEKGRATATLITELQESKQAPWAFPRSVDLRTLIESVSRGNRKLKRSIGAEKRNVFDSALEEARSRTSSSAKRVTRLARSNCDPKAKRRASKIADKSCD